MAVKKGPNIYQVYPQRLRREILTGPQERDFIELCVEDYSGAGKMYPVKGEATASG